MTKPRKIALAVLLLLLSPLLPAFVVVVLVASAIWGITGDIEAYYDDWKKRP